jgi:hypothetical protein
MFNIKPALISEISRPRFRHAQSRTAREAAESDNSLNLLLTVLHKVGVNAQKIGDSTGVIS